MEQQIYSKMHKVPFYEVNTLYEWHLSAMLDALVGAANEQLEQLDAGDSVMHAHDVGWVVTQYHFDITRFPKIAEPVELRTWADSYNQFFLYRDYQLNDAHGNQLVMIHSNWVMMSFKTRKMVRVIPEIIKNVQTQKISGIEKFPRIPKKDYTNALHKPYRVRYFDIDANHHVNNVHYFDWMIDTLDLNFITTHRIDTLDIRYEREIHYGKTPMSYVLIEPDAEGDGVTTYHCIQTEGETNTECMMHWQKR